MNGGLGIKRCTGAGQTVQRLTRVRLGQQRAGAGGGFDAVQDIFKRCLQPDCDTCRLEKRTGGILRKRATTQRQYCRGYLGEGSG